MRFPRKNVTFYVTEHFSLYFLVLRPPRTNVSAPIVVASAFCF